MKQELMLGAGAGRVSRSGAEHECPSGRRDGVAQQMKTFSWQMSSTGWFLVDFMAAYLSVWLAHWLVGAEAELVEPLRTGIIFGATVGVAGHVLGLHDTHHEWRAWKVFAKAGIAVSGGAVLLCLLEAKLVPTGEGRAFLGLIVVVAGAVMSFSRSLTWRFVRVNRHRVCVIGDGEFCDRSGAFLRDREGVRPLDVTTVELGAAAPGQGECHAPLEIAADGGDAGFVLKPASGGGGEVFDFKAWAEAMGVDEVVVQGYSVPALGASLLSCLDAGIRVSSFNEFVEAHYRCVPVEEIDHSWFLASRARGLGAYYQAFKRGIEVMVAVVGMIASLPLVAAAAAAIRASGPGPVFYSQVRVGLRNRPFRIYKLRTMRTDAEAAGAKWATAGDSRVTAVGRLLRKTRLDEVPQFWNIVRGDMAFIGPRPERPEFVGGLAEELPFYNQRHLVKPGLTGWAQINCAYAASADETRIKLKYDLYYVKHATLELDLHILIRTVGAIMKGAR